MHRLAPRWLLLALLLLGPGSVHAQDDDDDAPTDFTHDGWYLGAQGVYAVENFDTPVNNNDLSALTGSTSGENAFGVNGRVGYRFLRYLAAELELEWINGLEGRPGGNEVDLFPLALNLKFYPLGGLLREGWPARVQPFLQAGPSWVWASADRSGGNTQKEGGFAGRMGAGLEIYLTQNLALTADAKYMLPTNELDDLDYISVGWGLLWRFGAPD